MLYPTANPSAGISSSFIRSVDIDNPLFRDPSHGKAAIRQTYKHRCETCQHADYYEPEDIERYQHVSDERGAQ